jgi:hypothetical protein
MKKAHNIIACFALFFLLTPIGFVSAGQDDKDAPETLIKASRFLEQKPLDKDAKKMRSWAVQWLIVTDKVSVTVCSLLLSGTDKNYKYSSDLFSQYTIGMAAFKLTNPDKATDEDAAQQAGVESALISYESMVIAHPKAKNAFLDDLLAKRSQGTLADYVKENNCKGKDKK